MCGILCEICFKGRSNIKEDNTIQHRIKNRGPDYYDSTEVHLSDEVSIFFCASVLWMQGIEPTIQPTENDHGIMLYNGDIFDKTWSKELSDTEILFNKLTSALEYSSEAQFLNIIKSLKGPFSLIYYNKLKQEIFFARDIIGRNSMLLCKNENSVIISNVLGRNLKCVEVPAIHIQKFYVLTNVVKLYSRENDEIVLESTIDNWINLLQTKQNLPDNEFMVDTYTKCNILNETDIIIKYIEKESVKTKSKTAIMQELLKNSLIKDTVAEITNLLEKSIAIRLERQPKKCIECLKSNEEKCKHCSVGVLFSGGLDCAILAYLADKYLSKDQSIDLINVAFKKDDNSTFDVPDRLTGLQSLNELKTLCPLRNWGFIEVNITKHELEKYQMEIIADLVHPRQTILDESLGTALWFAARGLADNTRSNCRLLLLGSGADELFGGYTRHRNAYKRRGWQGLSEELNLDWNRISFRNLARDNRVICDHGRQPRMPYLDEDFTSYVLNLQPWLKCFPCENLPQGIGDKLMLRLVAFNLGLIDVATLPKRALQFGSRIANKKEKGSDISKTFLDRSQKAGSLLDESVNK